MLFSIEIVTYRGDIIETKRMKWDKAIRSYESLEAGGCLYAISLRQHTGKLCSALRQKGRS